MYFPSVFLSSSIDPKSVQEYRVAARDAVLDAQMTPVMFEYYRKQFTGGTPIELSEKMISDSDLFLGFYTGKYGKSVIDERDWVEFEYDFALSQHKPMVLFFPSKKHAWFNEADDKFRQFKQKISIYYQQYSDMNDLKMQITSLLVSPKILGSLKQRVVCEPIWGQPPSHSQYDADVFMVMPFRENLTAIYEKSVKPIVERNGLTIKRGDDFFNKHSIMDDIWAATYRTQIVIADCTGKNANVFYELGIAHALGRKSILIAQSKDDIPFDLQQRRCIFYSPDNLSALETELDKAIKGLIEV